MDLTPQDKKLLLEAAEAAFRLYQEFLMHDDWELSLSPAEVRECRARLDRYEAAVQVARRVSQGSSANVRTQE